MPIWLRSQGKRALTEVIGRQEAVLAPAVSDQRIASLDLIRGIAVLGILFANIVAFGHSFPVYAWPIAMPGGATDADKLFWVLQYVIIDHKMRGLFTLLFGAGMMLFMEKAWARGETRWLQFRRLMWLMLFGMLHFYLVWLGDILQLYAIWGAIALITMRWTVKTQLVMGLILYALGAFAMAVGMGSQYYYATNTEAAANLSAENQQSIADAPNKELEKVAKHKKLFQQGSYSDFVHHQVFEKTNENLQGQIFGVFETVSLILIGMSLYRYGFFSGAFDIRRMRFWGWVGLSVGAATSAGLALIPYFAGFPYFLTMFVFQGTMMLPRFAYVMGLMALLVVWAPRATQSWLGQRLVAAGRMAFTNYLGTSIAMLFVFHGWAFGLYGKLHRIELFGVVLAAWAVMLIGSKIWLTHFRYGPLEWLWRCLTYWRLFPIMR